jgi:hypothetical protein
MMTKKIFGWLAIAVVCSLLLTEGCGPAAGPAAKPAVVPAAEPAAVPAVEPAAEKAVETKPAAEKQVPPVRLALKFTPGDSTIYKVTTQAEDSVKFEGPLANSPDFRNARNLGKIEMTFNRQIQNTGGEGNAVAKITVEGLKYLAIRNNKPVLDFDSSREKDSNSPLAKLIGQSYTVEITPEGEVTKVIDIKRAQAAVSGDQPVNKLALRLLSANTIKNLLGTLVLPSADNNRLQTNDSWSDVKAFNFRMLGSTSYEKIYTIKEIKDSDSRRIAVIEMNAIPTTETQEQMQEEQTMNAFSKMFDNTETFTGWLKLDVTAGKVENYLEELHSEWLMVDPEAKQTGKEPDAVRMGVVRSYRLEKID